MFRYKFEVLIQRFIGNYCIFQFGIYLIFWKFVERMLNSYRLIFLDRMLEEKQMFGKWCRKMEIRNLGLCVL